MSRDRIMGLVWPEKNEERARRLLAVATYEIRRQLGEDVLVTRGEDLALDPEALPSDVCAFEAALEADEAERAAELYRGPFLDGFALRESVEFEHWADATREHYASRQRRALEQLARRRGSEGNNVGAVDAWRRLAAMDPFNDRVAIGLLLALDAADNLGGALEVARAHELLMQEEFGTDPGLEFHRTVAALRDPERPPRPPPPGPAPRLPDPVPEEPPEEQHGSSPEPARSPPPGPALAPDASSARRIRRSPRSRAWLRRALGSPRRRRIFLVTALAGVVLGLGAADLWRRFMIGPEDGVAVVVLPLLVADSADTAWADGLTEQLIEMLSDVPGLEVTVRGAAFALRGVEPAEALRRLDADRVLAGVARRDPEQVSVQLELSGPEGKVEWSESFTRSADLVLRIDTWKEIASAVRERIAPELGGLQRLATATFGRDEARPMARGGWTSDPVASDLYDQGRAEWFSRSPDGFARAQRYFSRALERDSSFARAWSGLADVYNLMGNYDYGVAHPDTAFPLARAAAERAIRLAPEFEEGWNALAHTLFVYDRDWEGAEEAYRKALELNPRFAQGHHRYSLFLVAMGREAEAMREARRALQLDSLSAVMNAAVARQRYFQRDYPGALAAYEKALRIDPAFYHPHLGKGLTLLSLDRPAEAVAALREALELTGGVHPLPLTFLEAARMLGGDTAAAGRGLQTLAGMRERGLIVPFEYDAMLHITRGAVDDALDALDNAFLNNSSVLVYLNVYPLADPLRGHPRFQALVEKVGLPRPAADL